MTTCAGEDRKVPKVKLGILGGTFDPVHFGHLRVAEEVGETLGLHVIYFIPAASPPHKEIGPFASFEHRLAMTRLAAEISPLLETLDLEGRRQGLSYSVETLREIRKMYHSDLELFFIIGIDAFLQIKTWKEHDRLFDYSHFVVIQRPGFEEKLLEPFLLSLNLGFKQKKGREGVYVTSSGNELIQMKATLMDISSTTIRKHVAEGKSIRFLVPDSVREYIDKGGLYKIHGDH